MNCRHCKHFKNHSDIFGYCKKYDEQALLTENCKQIKERIK
ncbi:hypothetical protein [Methanosphaera sp.]|nr:hypothetical protein [Methanosphaera sp.]